MININSQEDNENVIVTESPVQEQPSEQEEQAQKQATVQEQQKENRSPEERRANRYELTYAIGNLVCQVTVLFAMVFGVTMLFSSAINPYTAILNVINLFSIKRGVIFETLASLVITAIYIYLLVAIIKSTIQTVKTFLKIVKKSTVLIKTTGLNRLYANALDATYKAVLFIILCYIVSGSGFTVGSYLVIAVFLTNAVLNSTLLFIQKNKGDFKNKETILQFVFSILRAAVIITWSCLAAKVLIQPSALELSFGIRSLFSSVGMSGRVIEALYDLVVKHILDISLACIYIALLNLLFIEIDYTAAAKKPAYGEIKKYSRILLILAAICAAATCIIMVATGVNRELNIVNMYHVLKVQYLPAILFAVGLLVYGIIPFDKKEEPKQEIKQGAKQ